MPVIRSKDVGSWAGEHIKAGIKLGAELATNAAAAATAQKLTDAPLVRAQLLKTLGDFRTALTAEAAQKPALGAAVTTAFALLDMLVADRAAAGRAAAKRKGKDVAPTAPAATDTPATPTDS